MNKRCCDSTGNFPFPARALEEKAIDNFSYNNEKDQRPKQFRGTFEQFKEKILQQDGMYFQPNRLIIRSEK